MNYGNYFNPVSYTHLDVYKRQRVHRVPVNIVNYITAIFEDDNMSWTDLFTMAATNKKIHSFIMEYPQVIEDIRTLMGQPRSSSVHASALLVTPCLLYTSRCV